VYIQTEDQTLRLGWELTVEMENNWFYTVVDELDGSVLNVNDWVSSAPAYKVLPFGVEDPSFGTRETVVKTANLDVSPLGWHDTGAEKYAFVSVVFFFARRGFALLLSFIALPCSPFSLFLFRL
jgi:extracellular elastinolytic metalloproteinase